MHESALDPADRLVLNVIGPQIRANHNAFCIPLVININTLILHEGSSGSVAADHLVDRFNGIS